MLDEFRQLTKGIRPLESYSLEHVDECFRNGPAALQAAMVEFLRRVKAFPGVEVRAYANGFSFYTVDRSGQRRECGHFGINQDDRMVVYQHGDAFDPRGLFSQHMPSSESHRYGYITGQPWEVDYVKKILQRSFEKLRNR